jgi:hypothetical protein
MLPIKTTIEDINAVTLYLKGQVGWVQVERIKKSIPAAHADNRKLEALRYIGFIDRDGTNVKLTAPGREYASTPDDASRATILRTRFPSMPLYQQTLEWMHWSKKHTPTRTEIANYWHDNHPDMLEGAAGAALTDAAIFFLRISGAAGLGQFISAGRGRPETYLKVDPAALEAHVTSSEGSTAAPPADNPATPATQQTQPPAVTLPPAPPPPAFQTSVSPGIHINVEIHIAADATASTVEEIFKNMRKYVLRPPAPDDGE